ncbi:recombinase family protein [Sulfurimonas sp. C5]|uniref:recombinase family protein n=1 Tax=Sulfurimonas sp. C5 TaxID=3036947 RepID=UPI00245702D6|nr:recombinase family protein [Sulfurimonas sp. C5]MDH4945434.1 recombinase family protein [Sulfurimonas sp. C5]
MILAYIRPEKNFDAVHEQLQLINSYAITNKLVIDDEFIDYSSQNKRLEERSEVTQYFQSHMGSTLLVSDIWVLTTNMEDLIQMFSCLLRNEFNVHFIKQNVIMSKGSSAMLVLGLMDHLRQKLKEESKRSIGRPKGSKSSSKFDTYINEIVQYIKEGKSVSEIARLLKVSRSSLKDYIESRELKQVAVGSLLPKAPEDAEEHIINTIVCPN